jgi:hypothetical protein
MSAQPRKADDPGRWPAFLVLRNEERRRSPVATLREARDLVARAKAAGELIEGRITASCEPDKSGTLHYLHEYRQ